MTRYHHHLPHHFALAGRCCFSASVIAFVDVRSYDSPYHNSCAVQRCTAYAMPSTTPAGAFACRPTHRHPTRAGLPRHHGTRPPPPLPAMPCPPTRAPHPLPLHARLGPCLAPYMPFSLCYGWYGRDGWTFGGATRPGRDRTHHPTLPTPQHDGSTTNPHAPPHSCAFHHPSRPVAAIWHGTTL